MTAGSVYTRASWDQLEDYPLDPLPQDHPWPARENLTLRDYFFPLACNHLAFSIGRLAPGQSVEHHRHKEAEEVYLLLRGKAQIRINDDVIDATPLDAFRIPPDAYRSVYNNSTDECWWLFMGRAGRRVPGREGRHELLLRSKPSDDQYASHLGRLLTVRGRCDWCSLRGKAPGNRVRGTPGGPAPD